ncbi:hypothetical protein DF039_36895 [Burkholderia cenocepacia]|nr:hypothetical protein DF039_36895 [Burkholderia cenocepacia]
MCYSAKIQANYREYMRRYGAGMDIETFRRLYFARASGMRHQDPEASEDVRIATNKVESRLGHFIVARHGGQR